MPVILRALKNKMERFSSRLQMTRTMNVEDNERCGKNDARRLGEAASARCVACGLPQALTSVILVS